MTSHVLMPVNRIVEEAPIFPVIGRRLAADLFTTVPACGAS